MNGPAQISELKRRKPVILKYPVGNQTDLQPLPKPPGSWPFHLDIQDITSCEPTQAVDTMEFHLVGDTGSRRQPEFQRRVARAMGAQIRSDEKGRKGPHFLLHLGDIVYDHGEAHEYASQFFMPYENYPAPVLALAGNHDGDINPAGPAYGSLDAFMAVFCDTQPRPLAFSGGSRRLSQIQPNVYWSLQTPLANFICLYGNIPKFGYIDDTQFDWLLHELRTFGREKGEKVLFLCLHHAPYSADINHGSSRYMIDRLGRACALSGVLPDVVCSGHVHNYQRVSKQYPTGETVRYLVSGAGGYADLHRIADPDDGQVLDDPERFKGVTLENYCDTQHGFLKMHIERGEKLTLTAEYYVVQSHSGPDDATAALFERTTFVLEGSKTHSAQAPGFIT